MKDPKSPLSHTWFDDAQGIAASVALVSLALVMFRNLGLVTGGVAGLALVISYATEWPLGVLLFVINLPFYVLAFLRMGLDFTIKTIIAVALLSLSVELVPHWVSFEHLSPIYGSAMAGALVGVGFIALFRHRASLGGFGILAYFLQTTLGWRAGWTQMALDICVLALATQVVDTLTLVYSLIGMIVLNTILAVNHREGRYLAS